MACMKFKYLLALEFLLLLTLSPLHFMVEGRQISKLSNDLTMKISEEKVLKMRPLIGSKPPRCDGKKCKSCGNCEAVQVPIVTPKKIIFQKQLYSPRINTIAHSRGDYISNYKPMCWKCKCGDLYFSPGEA